MARFFSRSSIQQAAPQAVPNAQQPQQSASAQYAALRRKDISKTGKATTSQALRNLLRGSSPAEKQFATEVLRTLLDFKAAEYAKNNTGMQNALSQLRAAFSSPPPAAGVTYTDCLELGKNRSRIFKSKLPDTLRELAQEAMNVCGPRSVVTQTNHKFLFDAGLGGNVNFAQTRTSDIDECIRLLCRSCSKENDHIWSGFSRPGTSQRYVVERSFIGALQSLLADIDRDFSPQLEEFRTVSMRFGAHSDRRTLLHVATDFARQTESVRQRANATRVIPVIARDDVQMESPGVFNKEQGSHLSRCHAWSVLPHRAPQVSFEKGVTSLASVAMFSQTFVHKLGMGFDIIVIVTLSGMFPFEGQNGSVSPDFVRAHEFMRSEKAKGFWGPTEIECVNASGSSLRYKRHFKIEGGDGKWARCGVLSWPVSVHVGPSMVLKWAFGRLESVVVFEKLREGRYTERFFYYDRVSG